MAVIDSVPAPRVDAGFEARVWARLEEAIAEAGPFTEGKAGRRTAAVAALAAAAVLVIAVSAFLIGRWSQSSADAPSTAASTAPASHPVLLVDLGSHLDRAELALIELMTADGSDLADQRLRAENLVADNRLYRETAVDAGHRNVADVLDELERVLVEVAAAPVPAALGGVRQRVDARGLLFKLRVMRESLREDQTL
jgi:hypothetical protein